jgi:hypothetical protein
MQNFLALIGFLLPPAIDLINNKVADKQARFWVSVLVCGLVGAGIEWVMAGALSFEGVSTQILLTFGMAQLTYGALWKGSPADTELKKIQGV